MKKFAFYVISMLVAAMLIFAFTIEPIGFAKNRNKQDTTNATQIELTITSVKPNSAMQGEEVQLSIIGAGFDEATGVGFVPNEGIVTKNVKFVSATEMDLLVSINNNAIIGSRDVIVSSRDGKLASLKGGFTILQKGEIKPIETELTIASFLPPSGCQGESVRLRINGTGFVPGLSILFFESEVTLPQNTKSNNCGNTIHKFFIESIQKNKDEKGCHGIIIRKSCYIGTCILKSGHTGKHNYSYKKCKTHKDETSTEKFCTTDEAKKSRDTRYNELVKQQTNEQKELTGIEVSAINVIGTNEIEATATISIDAPNVTFDLYIYNPDGQIAVLERAFTVNECEEEVASIKRSETEYGEDYFRIAGLFSGDLSLIGWEEINLNEDGSPNVPDWYVPPSFGEGKTICFDGEDLIFAHSGKIVHLDWKSFVSSGMFFTKPPTGSCKESSFYTQILDVIEVLGREVKMRSTNGDTQFMCILSLKGKVNNWSCISGIWNKTNTKPTEVQLQMYIFTYVTLP